MPSQKESNSAGRVIAGTARGRLLVSPGEGTRPLGDRVKQTLFAILEPTIRGRAFLDLFAGSGAAGIEALSRGAEQAVFVERDAGAIKTIQRNLAAAGFAAPRARVVRSQVGTWFNSLSRGTGAHGTGAHGTDTRGPMKLGPFAAIMVDPPYDLPELTQAALESIAAAGPGGILDRDGVVIAKHFWKTPPAEVGLLRSARERRFGETGLTFLRWAEPAPDGEEDG
ncbi:MAG TPA: RsmD family RNA methyltransferase [Candidatus Limnocylindria bacterium]|nr:RsmD family RNA methyltransferase [Candidatus Limnocylindria bacterium]